MVAGVAVVAAFGLATPAQAESDEVYTTQHHGLMEYIDAVSDDLFTINDFYDDEYGVRGEIRSGGGTLLSWNYLKKGGGRDSWYYDLAKSKKYVIRVCLASSAGDTTPINCASKVVQDD